VDTQSTAELARVIQIAVAPVFLLLGIGGLLGVMAGRVARVIDRARRLESVLGESAPRDERIRAELDVLTRRAKLSLRAIALCVVSALLVAAVIIALFLGVFFGENVAYVVSIVFIAALVCLCGALVAFLQEIRLATLHLRIGQ
jgi:hypothetical protein